MAQIFMGGYPSESSVADLKRTHARTLQNRFNIRCHQLRAWQPVLTHNFTRQAHITAPPHVDECPVKIRFYDMNMKKRVRTRGRKSKRQTSSL